MTRYVFTSGRLGFRLWQNSDLAALHSINSDAEVMEYFPELPSIDATISFISQMQQQYEEKSLCYFPVERLDTGEFIGFIGLSEKIFEADFTPCVDVGWRLSKKHWGQGFATEGAKACLNYGFDVLGLNRIYSLCPIVNKRSEAVMQKIGMLKIKSFLHSQLKNCDWLQNCVLYAIESETKERIIQP